jgi:hypothetical protein
MHVALLVIIVLYTSFCGVRVVLYVQNPFLYVQSVAAVFVDPTFSMEPILVTHFYPSS